MEVTLINHMGTDLTVVNAARVSMAKESEWEAVPTCPHRYPDKWEVGMEVEYVRDSDDGWGPNKGERGRIIELRDPGTPARKYQVFWVKNKSGIWRTTPHDVTLVEPVKQKLSNTDAKLIAYLADNEHWTPFAHCQITMREKVPLFVARQRFKHTVGFVYNEVSRRYVSDPPEFYTPEKWRKRADSVKQGSSDEAVEVNKKLLDENSIERVHVAAQIAYRTLLDAGVCPEQARMVLPQSMYTEYYVTGSLAAWARAYKLRSDKHAQAEIRSLAAHWDRILKPLYPESWNWLIVS